MDKIMKVKANVTIYIDLEYEMCDTQNPRYDEPYKRLGEDYVMIRKGAVLDVYYKKEYYEKERLEDGSNIDPNVIVCVDKRCNEVIFRNLKELYKSNWFTEVKSDGQAKRD